MTTTITVFTSYDENLPPYAKAAQDFLAARCRAARRYGDPFTAAVTTRELVDAIDPRHETFKPSRWTGLRRKVFEPLAEADLAAGRPYLVALIRQPNPRWAAANGFWTNGQGTMQDVPLTERRAYWEGQMTAVVQLWGGTEADDVVDSALETFTVEVAEATARLRASVRRARVTVAAPKTCPGCGVELPMTGRCDSECA